MDSLQCRFDFQDTPTCAVQLQGSFVLQFWQLFGTQLVMTSEPLGILVPQNASDSTHESQFARAWDVSSWASRFYSVEV